MSIVWDTLTEVENYFEMAFNEKGWLIHEPGMERFNQPGWVNMVWESDIYRRAHIDVVDARETKGLWMMHCCVFPHTDNPAPIFGFDVVAGKNKITGCFHDFSPAGDPNHPLITWFGEEVSRYEWNKKRPLPEWAQRIFTEHMVAAGNVSEQHELVQILGMARKTLDHYLENVGETRGHAVDTKDAQNFYAQNQKQNPHTPKVMTSLGLNEQDVQIFVQECLFPEIR
jgi:phycocyanobilin:ferredoxin oxidoreductase